MFTQGAKSTSGLFNNSFPIAKRSFEKREAHISKLFVVSTLGRKSWCILKPWLSAVLNRRSRPRSLCDRVHPAMGNTLYHLKLKPCPANFSLILVWNPTRSPSPLVISPEVQGRGRRVGRGRAGGGEKVWWSRLCWGDRERLGTQWPR